MNSAIFDSLINNFLENKKENLNKKVIIFGTGSTALQMCPQISNIHFFVDNDEKKWNSIFLEKSIYPPNALSEIDRESILIIIASMFYNDIKNQLIGMGFEENIHFINGNLISEIFAAKKKNENIKYNHGYCPVCQENTIFFEKGTWLRDCYFCFKCQSIPRQRALMHVLSLVKNNYNKEVIHESSPCGAPFDILKKQCENYTYSYFFPGIRVGGYKNSIQCQNIEEMSFEDDSFDIFITQDVLEHILNPKKAFKEIARVLKKGGIHIFTVPYDAQNFTVTRSKEIDGNIVNILTPTYHGDPINSDGCLVITDWGKDICDYIYKCSGLTTTIYCIINRDLGIDGEYTEVFVSLKAEN